MHYAAIDAICLIPIYLKIKEENCILDVEEKLKGIDPHFGQLKMKKRRVKNDQKKQKKKN